MNGVSAMKGIARAALLGLLLAGPAAARPQLADLEVYDRTAGRFLTVHHFQGQRYVAGQPGHEYELRLRSRSGERLLAVASVDGVNVVSGETAAPDQSGYVLGAYQSLGIAGWRKSLDETAAFYFTKHRNSYAARTGRPFDVGVIGVALFRESRAAATGSTGRTAKSCRTARRAPRPKRRAPTCRAAGRRRSSAPAMAGASTRPPATPNSSAHPTRPTRSWRSTTTRARTWWRRAWFPNTGTTPSAARGPFRAGSRPIPDRPTDHAAIRKIGVGPLFPPPYDRINGV
jgi:hypothetical protein